jgi:hypothetical protein
MDALRAQVRVADWDPDNDGMPTEWEKAQGLDLADPSGGNGDKNGDGYTNLEEYLNWLVSQAPRGSSGSPRRAPHITQSHYALARPSAQLQISDHHVDNCFATPKGQGYTVLTPSRRLSTHRSVSLCVRCRSKGERAPLSSAHF